jgi:hypothetical protein
MEANLPFVAMQAPSCKTQAAASASSTACLVKVAKVGSGCPSYGGQRTVASVRTRENSQSLSKRMSLSIVAPSFESASLHTPSWPGAFSRHQSSASVQASVGQLAHPALVCFAIPIQSKAASPRAWPNPSFKRTRLRRSA